MFRNKWLTLIDRGKNDLSIKGYLKCDLFMFYDIKSTDKLILPKPLNSTFEDFEINEKWVTFNIYVIIAFKFMYINNF